MKVAAVLVNYYDAQGISEAAWSVMADKSSVDIDIVVVDNSCNSDQLNELYEKLPGNSKIISAEKNLGFAQGCNLALQNTDAAFILLVNPDVRFREGAVSFLLAELLGHSNIAATGPRQFLDPDCLWALSPTWLPTSLRIWATETVMRNTRHRAAWLNAVLRENLRYWMATQPIAQRALSGGAMMVRRAALQTLCPSGEQIFDPDFFMYFEDSDLSLRLRQAGWALTLTPQAQAIHAWQNAPHKAELMSRSQKLFLDKHFGAKNSWYQKAESLWSLSCAEPWQQDFILPNSSESFYADNHGPSYLEASPNFSLWPSVGRFLKESERISLDAVLPVRAHGGTLYFRLTELSGLGIGSTRYFSLSD